MKRVFLLSLGLLLGLSAFAQKPVIKADKVESEMVDDALDVGGDINTTPATFNPQHKSVVVNKALEFTTAETIYTNYDLQSNRCVSNRMYQMPDGSVAVVAAMSHEKNRLPSDLGTGYNFCVGGDNEGGWGEQPDERIESLKTGWPSIAQYGENGEIFVSYAAEGIYVFYREVAGEGEWIPVNGNGKLPVQVPSGYTNNATPGWPRIATSGDNHNIVHILADIQYTGGSEVLHTQVIFRSENLTNWTCEYSPLAADGEAEGLYVSDAYSIATNGHNVAIIYSGKITAHAVMYKSADDGLTWERTVIWENPYYGCDWEEDSCSIYTDTVYGPANSTICLDNNGVAHVAMNVYEYMHEELGTSYRVWSDLTSDGIAYWNDTQEAPIQSIDGNPHHALRLWWPGEGGYSTHLKNDSVRFCGWIAPEGESYWQNWNNYKFYHENEYLLKFYGASASPALAVDPEGNLACAYSTPTIGDGDGTYYYRQAYVSYKNAGDNGWHVAADNLQKDFGLSMGDGIFVNAVQNSVNTNEFWFSYSFDDVIGLYNGSNATQTMTTDNYIKVVKYSSEYYDGVEENEAKDVVYNIYPNPATDYVVIESSMNADATVTFINLAGQTVKKFNRSLTIGANNINIDLERGVYFCTVNANGFNKTTKVIVK